MLVYLFVSLTVSTGIVLFFRHLDRNNRNFEKIAKLYKQIRADFDHFADEKYQSLKDYDSLVEVSITKGDSLLNNLKSSIENLSVEYQKINSERDEAAMLKEQIDSLTVAVSEIKDTFNNVESNIDFVKNVEFKIDDFRKEIALFDRDLNRIEDNFKKENCIALKDISDQVLSQSNTLYNDFTNSIDNKCVSLKDQFDYYERQYAAKETELVDTLSKYKDEIGRIESSIEVMHDNFIENLKSDIGSVIELNNSKINEYKNIFKDIEYRLVELLNNQKDQALNAIGTTLSGSIGEINNYYTELKKQIASYVSNLYNAKNQDTEQIIESLRVLEERIDTQFLAAGKISDKIESDIIQLKERIDSEVKSKIDYLNSIVTKADDFSIDLENELYRNIKERLENYNVKVVKELDNVTSNINERVNKSWTDIKDVQNEIRNINQKINELSERYEADENQFNEYKNSVRGNLDNEVSFIKDFIKDNFADIQDRLEHDKLAIFARVESILDESFVEADSKTIEIKDKIDGLYDDFLTKVKQVEKLISDKSEDMDNFFYCKLNEIDKKIDQERVHFDSAIDEKLKFMESALSENGEKISGILKGNESMIESVQSEIRIRFEDLNKQLEDSLKGFNQNKDTIEVEFMKNLKLIEEKFRSLNNELYNESISNYNTLNSKYENMNVRIGDYEKEIVKLDDVINKEIVAKSAKIKEETDNLIKTYESEISSIDSYLKRIEDGFERKLKDKYEQLDRDMLTRLKDVNDIIDNIKDLSGKYNNKFADFDDRIENASELINKKITDIETDFNERGEKLFSKNISQIEEYDRKIETLGRRIDEVRRGFETDINNSILSGKASIDDLLSKGNRKLGDTVENLNNDVNSKIHFYQSELGRLGEAFGDLEKKMNYKIDETIDIKNAEVKNKFNELINMNAENIDLLKTTLKDTENSFKNRLSELEIYYNERVNGLIDEKIKFVDDVSVRIDHLAGKLSYVENEFTAGIETKIGAAKDELDSIVAMSSAELKSKYFDLEKETVLSIDRYKDALIKIKNNIKIIDEKFSGKFLNKLTETDNRLREKLAELDVRCASFITELNTKLNGYDNDYFNRLKDVENGLNSANEEIIKNSKLELSEYTTKIESLMDEIANVRTYLSEEISQSIESGKMEISEFAKTENAAAGAEYRELKSEIMELIGSYKGQIHKIKDNIKEIDEKINIRMAEKLNMADNKIQERYNAVLEKYNKNIRDLNEKTLDIEDSLRSRIDEISESYVEKGETLLSESYEKINGINLTITDIKSELKSIKSGMESDLNDIISAGRSKVEQFMSSAEDSIYAHHKTIEQEVIENINSYKVDILKFRDELMLMDDKINSSLREKLNSLNDKIVSKTGEADRVLGDNINLLKGKVDSMAAEISDKLAAFEGEWSGKNEDIYRENAEKYSDFARRFGELEKSIDSLDKNIHSELVGRVDAAAERIISDVKDKIFSIHDDYKAKLDLLYDETGAETREALARYEAVKSDIDDMKTHMDSDIKQKIDENMSEVNTILQSKREELITLYNEFEYDSSGKLAEYRKIIDSARDHFDGVLAEINHKYSENAALIGDKLDSFYVENETAIREKIGILTKKIESFDNEIGEKFGELKLSSENLTKQVITFNEEQIKSVSGRMDELKADVEDLNRMIYDKIDSAVEGSVAKLENVINEKTLIINSEYQELSRKLSDETSSLNDTIGRIKQNINDFDVIFNAKFDESNVRADKRFNEFIVGLKEKIDFIEYNFNVKLDEISSKTASDSKTVLSGIEMRSTEVAGTLEQIKKDVELMKYNMHDEFESAMKSGLEKTALMLDKSSADVKMKLTELSGMVNSTIGQADLNLSGKMDEMTGRVVALEDEVERRLNDYLSFLNNKENINSNERLKEIEMLKADVAELRTGILNSYNEADETLKAKLNENDRRIKEYLQDKSSLFESYNKENIDKLNVLSGELERFRTGIDNLKEDSFHRINETLDSVIKIGEARFDKSIEKFEAKSTAKFDELDAELLTMKSDIDKLYTDFDARFSVRMERFDAEMSDNLTKINTVYQKNLIEFRDDLDAIKVSVMDEIDMLANNSRNNISTIEKESADKLSALRSDLNGLNENVDSIKSRVNGELATLKDATVKELNTTFDDRKYAIETEYRALEKDLIARINNYRTEIFKVQQNISSIEMKYEELFSKSVNGYQNRFNDELKKSIEIFEDKTEKMIYKTSERLDNYEMKFVTIQDMIKELTDKVDSDVKDAIAAGKGELDNILSDKIDANKIVMENENQLFIRKIEDYKSEFIKLQNNMKQVDDRFTARFLEHSSLLDKRIAAVEQEMSRVEKHTQLFDKANNLKDRLNTEMKEIKERIDEIKNDKVEILKYEKNLVNLEKLSKETEDKYSKLLNDAKKIDNVNEVLIELKNMSNDVDSKVENIKSAKALITNVEDRVSEVYGRMDSINKILESLENREDEIKENIKDIDVSKISISEISNKIESLNKSLGELEFKSETYDKTLKKFEKESFTIANSQNKINDVLDKFKQMDSLVIDLEQRTDSINRIREWLVRAETQMENLNYETDKRIKLLETLVNDSADMKSVDNAGGDDKKDMVVKLYKQGWTLDDIARTAGISLGEIEFILDLELTNTRKKR